MKNSDKISFIRQYTGGLLLGGSIFICICILGIVLAYILGPYSFDTPENGDVSLQDFQKNFITYSRIADCIKTEGRKTEKCLKLELSNGLNVYSEDANFITGLCRGVFTGDYISIGKGMPGEYTHKYVKILAPEKQAIIIGNMGFGSTIIVNDKEIGLNLKDNWVMCDLTSK